MAEYHPLYLDGIDSFNRQAYFDSHETWEKLWGEEQGPARQFYKGLIQAAVALHHLARGNQTGAQRLLDGCREYLGPYRPSYQGLDVAAFIAQMGDCVERMMSQVGGMHRTDHLLADAPLIRLSPSAK